MKNRSLLLLATLLCLGAQAQVNGPDRPDIVVTVENGATTVREEVARTTRNQGAVVWRAPEGYRFSDDGIVLEGADQSYRCAPQNSGRRFRCQKLRHVSGEEFKYIVNLVDARTGKALEPLDPVIISD